MIVVDADMMKGKTWWYISTCSATHLMPLATSLVWCLYLTHHCYETLSVQALEQHWSYFQAQNANAKLRSKVVHGGDRVSGLQVQRLSGALWLTLPFPNNGNLVRIPALTDNAFFSSILEHLFRDQLWGWTGCPDTCRDINPLTSTSPSSCSSRLLLLVAACMEPADVFLCMHTVRWYAQQTGLVNLSGLRSAWWQTFPHWCLPSSFQTSSSNMRDCLAPKAVHPSSWNHQPTGMFHCHANRKRWRFKAN